MKRRVNFDINFGGLAAFAVAIAVALGWLR